MQILPALTACRKAQVGFFLSLWRATFALNSRPRLQFSVEKSLLGDESCNVAGVQLFVRKQPHTQGADKQSYSPSDNVNWSKFISKGFELVGH